MINAHALAAAIVAAAVIWQAKSPKRKSTASSVRMPRPRASRVRNRKR